MPTYIPNNLLIQELHGAVGDLVFYRDADGRLIVQKKGERTAPLSEKQRARNDAFRLASVYGNQVKMDAALAAEYRALCSGRMRPYHVAVRDYLRPPRVDGIDLQSFTGQPGQLIQIVATDDTRVMSVQVEIRDAASQDVLERGPAALSVIADQWLYTTTTSITGGTAILVEATAVDRPGHIGSAAVPYVVPH